VSSVVKKNKMKKTSFFLVLLIISIHSFSQTFTEFIDKINSMPISERQAKTDSFMNACSRLPYTESDTLCNFIYKGNASGVSVAGDFTGWKPTLAMIKIQGTDLWYYSTHFECDARLDYKYVIDGNNWTPDPKNPYVCASGFGSNSELRMPWYLVPPEIGYYRAIPHGTIRDTTFYSVKLGNSRQVKIYLPAGYDFHRKYPLVLFHDGPEYLSIGNANNILDYMIFYQDIEPLIAVFVPPADRESEYAGSKKDAFTEFIVNELMPAIEKKYTITSDPGKRATVGASNGGNIAIYIGMKHPESFGKIAAQSSNVENSISENFKNSEKMDLEFYIDIGKYDITELVPLFDHFTNILNDKKYPFQSKVWNEGHSWGSWKGHLSAALRQFFLPGTGQNNVKNR
jgi:enterochelin esterase-like enzyme